MERPGRVRRAGVVATYSSPASSERAGGVTIFATAAFAHRVGTPGDASSTSTSPSTAATVA